MTTYDEIYNYEPTDAELAAIEANNPYISDAEWEEE